ncbi:MAG: ATP-binding cassette domain-containing protein, partial [Candidatus Omnitrophica bacterium]|nr:ATP-binding cassette domain-containing protein [Candidatus Omnitrophota bacterium]
LTHDYDLIFLDEPTNYLDLNATLWLKDYLTTYPGTFVLISHDRVFLNDVTNYTIILDGAKMTKVKGNYEAYETQKEVDMKTIEKRKRVVDQKRKQLERFAERFHAQPNRASAVKNKRKMIERLEEITIGVDKPSIKDFTFSGIQQSGYVVAQTKKLSKAYGEKTIYRDFDFEIIRNQKICLVGPNGAGKSTLLKMLAGVLKPDAGEVQYGHQVDVGYFSQSRLDVLNPNRNAFEEVVSSTTESVPAVKIRSLLGLFNFHGDEVFKQVKVLSGGEKSRLILAKLLINPPNFILLDEPTTHLDLDGVKSLTHAFQQYTGTLCFISHDLYFIREVSDHIVEIGPGEINNYPGGFQYYLDKKGLKSTAYGFKQASADKSTSGAGSDEDRRESGQSRKSSNKGSPEKKSNDSSALQQAREKQKEAKRRVSQIKKEIKRLEEEQKSLDTETYVKTRKLNSAYENRDADIIKEYSQRLKDIQTRMREIETTLESLEAERLSISK